MGCPAHLLAPSAHDRSTHLLQLGELERTGPVWATGARLRLSRLVTACHGMRGHSESLASPS